LVSPEGRGVIRLAQPAIGDDEIAAVSAVLRSGWLVQGVAVHAYESEVARLAGTEHAVAVTNGTAALHLSLMALGIGRNDRVAVSKSNSVPGTPCFRRVRASLITPATCLFCRETFLWFARRRLKRFGSFIAKADFGPQF
jgi:hypothetical protein